ncbi:rhamnogalacturonan acetylesterase [Bacillus sp. 31A1R]|uniref:Rhamnogalacturonan acetylesterase n=1 Tax=Robertmurraya mangrovi TaxID=3098077 RepID=A0ABU5IYS6_9BACI|nr:rhamnogalacturonan acetylesterase [Bacillus sp. 31A1R]MDZ5472286.1 rhamnogalacturonan acetylesterase [Bacillus sp. 31A1R]
MLGTAKKDVSHQKGKVTVFLAGDSTVSNYTESLAPRAGWGQMIGTFFDEDVVIINAAKSGRSSKSFIEEKRLKKILRQIDKGDYLFIQFGHNDQKAYDPNRYTDPHTTYKSYLKNYIDGARKKKAIPVLVTSVERRFFLKDGVAGNSHGDYQKAMIELGKEENVPVIDLASNSRTLFNKLGPEKTKELFLWLEPGESENFPDGIQDDVHFKEHGAREIARLVVEGIRELNLEPLSTHIKK